MGLRQPKTTYNSRIPIQKPALAHSLRDDRCFDCQLGARPCARHPTCLHQNEFAPTPNRFSILAGLSPPPDTKWPLDFTPPSRPSPRRRGRRGGKQQRLKHALRQTTCETAKVDSVDKLCERLDALHLDNDAPTTALQSPDEPRSTPPTQSPLSDVNTVRHQWAPQFCLDSRSPPQGGLQSQGHPRLDQGFSSKDPSVNILPSHRSSSPQFPLSAFLRNLTSPNKCQERWPCKTSTQQPASLSITTPSSLHTIVSSVTPAESAAAAAASRAIALHNNAASSFHNVMKKTPQAAQVTSPLSDNATRTTKRPLSFDVPPFTPASEPIPAVHTLPPVPSPSATKPSSWPLPASGSSSTGAKTALPTSNAPFINFPNLPILQQVATAREQRSSAPQRSPFSWLDTSESTPVFRPSPTAMVTAPVTSPYPFVCPIKPWSPVAMSAHFSQDIASRPKIPMHNSPPEAQKSLAKFLGMGHAKNCWCSKSSHGEARKPTTRSAAALRGEIMSKAGSANSQTPSRDAVPNTTHASNFVRETEKDFDSGLADDDGVLIASSSEDSSSEFEELDMIDGRAVKSDSEDNDEDEDENEDEDWFALSPRAPTPLSTSSPTSWTVSDVSARSSNATPLHELPAALPPLQQPSASPTGHAQISNNESETEWGYLRFWTESPEQSVDALKRELWDMEVEPKTDTPGKEWPTLQDAVSKPLLQQESRAADDDAWGGKIWDGVTDWF